MEGSISPTSITLTLLSVSVGMISYSNCCTLSMSLSWCWPKRVANAVNPQREKHLPDFAPFSWTSGGTSGGISGGSSTSASWERQQATTRENYVTWKGCPMCQAPLAHSTHMSQLSFTLPGKGKVRDRLSRETTPPFNFPHSVSVTASSTISRKHRKRFSLPASAGTMSASSCQTNQIAHRRNSLSRHLLARTVADLSLSLYKCVCVCA